MDADDLAVNATDHLVLSPSALAQNNPSASIWDSSPEENATSRFKSSFLPPTWDSFVSDHANRDKEGSTCLSTRTSPDQEHILTVLSYVDFEQKSSKSMCKRPSPKPYLPYTHIWYCECAEKATCRITKKDGPNKGRKCKWSLPTCSDAKVTV